jgi:hypothetical protein
MYFLTSGLTQILARFPVVLEIAHRVIKRDVRRLHELIDLRPVSNPSIRLTCERLSTRAW